MEASITVAGDAEFASLWDWLQNEPMFRGRLQQRPEDFHTNAMGLGREIAIALVPTAGLTTALARSLSVWLVQRRSDVTVTVAGSDGRTITVESRRVASAETVMQLVLDTIEPPSSAPPTGTTSHGETS